MEKALLFLLINFVPLDLYKCNYFHIFEQEF